MTVDGGKEAAHAAVPVAPGAVPLAPEHQPVAPHPPPVVVEHTVADQHLHATPPHGAPCVGVPVGMPASVTPPILVERRLVGKRLKPEGWACACVLLFLFWPLACVPCCLDDCKEEIWEDVYVTPQVVTNAQGVLVTPNMVVHAPPPQHIV